MEAVERNVGTITGPTRATVPGGLVTTAVRFTNAADKLTFPHRSTYNITKALSVVARVRLTATGSYPFILAHCTADANTFGYSFALSSDTRKPTLFLPGPNTTWSNVANTAVTTNTWTTIGGTFLAGSSAGRMRFYHNGRPDGGYTTSSGNLSLATGEPMRIGCRHDNFPWVGYIDCVYVYNRELTAAEMAVFSSDPYTPFRNPNNTTYFLYAAPPVTGEATGTLTITGEVDGTVYKNANLIFEGSNSTSFTEAPFLLGGSAGGDVEEAATTSNLTLTSSASSTCVRLGSGNGTLSLTATATAACVRIGQVASTLTLNQACSGNRQASAGTATNLTLTVAVQVSRTASAAATSSLRVIITGTGQRTTTGQVGSDLQVTTQGQGHKQAAGASTGSLSVSGVGTGQKIAGVNSQSQLSLQVAASGQRTAGGAASASLVITGLVTAQEIGGTTEATAAGSLSLTTTATALLQKFGVGTGTLTLQQTGAANRKRAGTTASTCTLTTTANTQKMARGGLTPTLSLQGLFQTGVRRRGLAGGTLTLSSTASPAGEAGPLFVFDENGHVSLVKVGGVFITRVVEG